MRFAGPGGWLALRVDRYESPGLPLDDPEHDWLAGAAALEVAGFAARTGLSLLADELEAFHALLGELVAGRASRAGLGTLEDQLELTVTRDRGGTDTYVHGRLTVHAVASTEITELVVEPAGLAAAHAGLTAIVRAFPDRSADTGDRP